MGNVKYKGVWYSEKDYQILLKKEKESKKSYTKRLEKKLSKK